MMSSYESVSSETINNESLTLLKQQMTKLKFLSSQLDLKTNQYQLLKETAQSLDDEKMVVEEENHRLKNDLMALILHNQQCDSSLHQSLTRVTQLESKEKQNKRRIEELEAKESEEKNNGMELQKTIEKLIKEQEELQKRIEESNESNTSTKSHVDALLKDKKELKDTNKKLTTQLSGVTSKLDNLAVEYSLSVDQLHSLKHRQQTVLSQLSQYQKQSSSDKQLIHNLEQKLNGLLFVQQEYSQTQRSFQRMRKQLLKIESQHLKVQQQNMRLRKEKISLQENIKHDMGVISNVLRLKEHSGEYLSCYGDTLRSVAKEVVDSSNINAKTEKEVQLLKQEVHECHLQLKEATIRCSSLQRELQLSESTTRTSIQTLINKHQSQHLSLSLSLKTKQSQLHQLSHRCTLMATESVQLEQRVKEVDEKRILVTELSQSNTSMKETMQQMLLQCEEGIECKRSLNILKYVVANVMRHLFYSVSQIKSLLVFKEYFKSLQTRYSSQQKRHKSNKFRVAVTVVRAINRMRHSLGKCNPMKSQPPQTKDKLMNCIVTRSIRLDQNQITASFVKSLSLLLDRTRTDVEVTVQLIQLFDRTYEYKHNRNLGIKY